MKLPSGLTTEQIRVLQEFRRKAQDELTPEELDAINHPGGAGGVEPANALVSAGFLASADGGFRLTDKGREFLARPSEPLQGSEGAASAE
jgi:hypothetical protein